MTDRRGLPKFPLAGSRPAESVGKAGRSMAIYEYDCPKCGTFEFEQSMMDDALKKCPDCRSKVTKLISQSSFVLKGGGWYSDSYQKKAEAPCASKCEAASECPAATGSD